MAENKSSCGCGCIPLKKNSIEARKDKRAGSLSRGYVTSPYQGGWGRKLRRPPSLVLF